MSRSPTMAEVIREAIHTALVDVHTSLPARVIRYESSHQLVDVQPLIKSAYLDEQGERIAASLPTVRNCPVQFSGGGGTVIMHPIAVGDIGLLIFSESSIDTWLSGSGGEIDPGIDYRHNLSDGFFIPGIRTVGSARKTDPGSAVCIGVDGGSFEGVPLGSRLASLFNSHSHSASGSGPPIISITADDNPTTGFVSSTVKVT